MAKMEAIWRLARTKGPKAALVAFGSVLLLGVANKLTEGAITAATDRGLEFINPPTFVVSFSEPLDQKPVATITRMDARADKVEIERVDVDALIVAAGAGNYRLKLERTYEGESEVLPVHLPVQSANQMVRVDTADEHWVSVKALAKEGDIGGGSGSGVSRLVDTRWTVASTDRDQAQSAPTELNRRIVEISLGQVGLREDGPLAEREQIARYWSQTNLASMTGASADSLSLPWGGAFLGYVVRSAGAEPPGAAPAFPSWQTWGAPVDSKAASPGDLVVFPMATLPEARSRLLVGVMLKRRPDCIDVVAGNVANRVVITCVRRPVIAVRRAILPSDDEKGRLTAAL